MRFRGTALQLTQSKLVSSYPSPTALASLVREQYHVDFLCLNSPHRFWVTRLCALCEARSKYAGTPWMACFESEPEAAFWSACRCVFQAPSSTEFQAGAMPIRPQGLATVAHHEQHHRTDQWPRRPWLPITSQPQLQIRGSHAISFVATPSLLSLAAPWSAKIVLPLARQRGNKGTSMQPFRHNPGAQQPGLPCGHSSAQPGETPAGARAQSQRPGHRASADCRGCERERPPHGCSVVHPRLRSHHGYAKPRPP